jgi:hypothetical protein
VLGNRLASPARNPDLVSFERGHGETIADQYGNVRYRTSTQARVLRHVPSEDFRSGIYMA